MSVDFFYPCCYLTPGSALTYAAVRSPYPHLADAVQAEEVVVTSSVTRSAPKDLLCLSMSTSSLFVLEAPFVSEGQLENLQIDSRVVWWTFGKDDVKSRDPFDSTLAKRIVVKMGTVVSFGRLDEVHVLLDDQTNPMRVKRRDLRKIVMSRSDSALPGSSKRKDAITRKLKLGDGSAGPSMIRFAPQFVGVGHDIHDAAPALHEINRLLS